MNEPLAAGPLPALEEAQYLDRLRALRTRHWPKDVPQEPHYPFGEVALSEYLRGWARRQLAKPAVIFYGAELSYGELDRLSDRCAGLLAARGVKPGDRVAVLLPNCPQYFVAFYGILKLGAVHVPVNPLFKEHELLYELNDSGAEVMIAQDQLMPLVRMVRPKTRLRHVFVTSYAEVIPAQPSLPVPASIRAPRADCPDAEDLLPALAARDWPAPAGASQLDAIAALNYTGGTTGMPKGCVHTQRDMIYTAATTCACALQATPEDVWLNFYPVFWIAGEDLGLLFPIFCGSTCVLLARWDPVAFMAAVQRYRVGICAMLVDNAVEVLEHPEASRYDLRPLNRLRVSSFVKKLNPDYRARWRRLTGHTMIEAAWGMTETHTCDTFTVGFKDDDVDLKSQPIFVGMPVPGTEIKICDFDTGALIPIGQEGEICVRSPSLLKSYWNRPEATAQSLKHGWLFTGDIGLLDDMGLLHFLGRRKEMLKINGMSVFPAEIEALLGQHPAVLGSGVIGKTDPDKGQVPLAFVMLKPEQRGQVGALELEAWCRANMAGYKVPLIRLVEALPLTATGKVKKDELAKLES